jgi:hypothetical protein
MCQLNEFVFGAKEWLLCSVLWIASAFGGVMVKRMWQGDERELTKIRSGLRMIWPFGDEGLEAIIRTIPAAFAAWACLSICMAIGGFWSLAPPDYMSIRTLSVRLAAIVAMVAMLCVPCVTLFSRPKFLIAPGMRGDPSLLSKTRKQHVRPKQ